MTTPSAEAPAAHPPRVRPRRNARALGLLVGMLGLIALLHVYLGSHLFAPQVLPTPWGDIGWAVLAALFLAIPATILLRLRNNVHAARLVQPVAYFWLGAFGVVLSVVFATDVGRWVWRLLHGPATPWELERVARTQAVLIVVLGGLLVAWARQTALGTATVERVTVPIRGLGPGLAGLRIVQISDIHIGESLKRSFLERTVAQVNALDPDIIAVTGDLVDGPVAELREELAPLSELRAKLGVFYVTGNHEYYWDGPAWEAEVERRGLTVLRNAHRVLERGGDRLVLGGVPDLHGGDFAEGHTPSPEQAFQGAPDGVPRILLAHQPRAAEGAARAGVALQLSGHTHGGQVFPFTLFVRLQQPTVQGLKKVAGMWVYTHRGTGFWGPAMRLGPSPEIAELTLTPAAE